MYNFSKKHFRFKKKEEKELSNRQYYILKMFAIIFMVTDHIAYFLNENVDITPIKYLIMRSIGRLSYPIFAYLLIESYFYTKDKRKHLLKIIMLGIISEPFFDYFTTGKWINLNYQNICFSLALSYMYIKTLEKDITKWMLSVIEDKKLKEKVEKKKEYYEIFYILSIGVIYGAIACLLKFDYSYSGIVLTAGFLVARKVKHKKEAEYLFTFLFATLTKNVLSFFALLSLTIINTAKKVKVKDKKVSGVSKNVCRYFYPLHLMIFVIIKIFVL